MKTLIDYYPFLDGVAANNNRAWMADHRDEFVELQKQWYDQLAELIAYMSTWEPRVANLDPKNAAYRFYRDTRFSADKTPYKTYFSAAIAPYGKKSPHAAYYLQLDAFPNYNGLHAGLWCPDAAMLRKMRKAIVDNIEEFEEILVDHSFANLFTGWDGETLKTVPKGYDRNHPQANLLRLKNYGKIHRVDRDFFRDPNWPKRASDIFLSAKKFVDFINYSLDETF